jgi:hypothetical protein
MLDLNSRRGRYDFILQPHRELGRFVENGHLEALEKYLADAKLRDPSFNPDNQLIRDCGRRSPGTTAKFTVSRSPRSPCTCGTGRIC